MLETIESPTTSDTDNPDSVAHIVKGKNAVTEAYIFGNELEALCGHRFVPSRDPENKPVCQPCKEKRG